MVTESPLPATIGLLRHGQTEWNVAKRIQGSGNSPLTPEGRLLTANWIPTLQKYGWDRILASDLGRVKETVAILNKKLCLPVSYDERLREQHWGEWEGVTLDHIKENFAVELARRVLLGWQFSAPGGETRTAVKERALSALRENCDRWPGKKLLVICHQGVIKAILYHITNRAFIPEEDRLLHHNRLHILQFRQQQFHPLELNICQQMTP